MKKPKDSLDYSLFTVSVKALQETWRMLEFQIKEVTEKKNDLNKNLKFSINYDDVEKTSGYLDEAKNYLSQARLEIEKEIAQLNELSRNYLEGKVQDLHKSTIQVSNSSKFFDKMADATKYLDLSNKSFDIMRQAYIQRN
ncbi:MAG: hypothetical protein ABIC91_00730 [Nanoarchaeota archaeon]|nr:hypothetical protein [Nanoarchaeota archaeon]MBU1029896.1 hypothetical protein [Nanoarchaeota archaeon]MBU1849819.1 hypothetical protein [Nanoarchaeota archaeon]